MNGRVYDPVIGRMLSPDMVVQNPTMPQNYDRYAYAYNNPLKYTDPSGYVMRMTMPGTQEDGGGGGGGGAGGAEMAYYVDGFKVDAWEANLISGSGGAGKTEVMGSASTGVEPSRTYHNVVTFAQDHPLLMAALKEAYQKGAYSISNNGLYYDAHLDMNGNPLQHDADGNIITPDLTKTNLEVGYQNANQLDPSTVGRNMFNDNYTGKDNPQTYGGTDSYTTSPKNLRDLFSYQHDKGYDSKGAKGFKSVALNPSVIGIDLEFARNQYAAAAFDLYTGKPIEAAKDIAAGTFIGAFGVFKLFNYTGLNMAWH